MFDDILKKTWSKSVFLIYNLLLPLIVPLIFLIVFKFMNTELYFTAAVNQTITVFLFVSFFINIGVLTDDLKKFNLNAVNIDPRFSKNKSKYIAISILMGTIGIALFTMSYMIKSFKFQIGLFIFNTLFVIILLFVLHKNPFVQNSESDTMLDFKQKDITDEKIELGIINSSAEIEQAILGDDDE